MDSARHSSTVSEICEEWAAGTHVQGGHTRHARSSMKTQEGSFASKAFVALVDGQPPAGRA